MAVVDYLYELDIPYECMSVTGFGRSHSVALAGWLNADPVRTVVTFDNGGQALAEDFGEQVLAPERIVRIFGIHHDSSVCDLTRQRLGKGERASLPIPLEDETRPEVR